MRPLSILFTNNTLAWRAGSELWVRDMCTALVGRGHHPLAFSLVTGAIAEELRAATVPVVTDLSQVGFTPDLIHGHHHVETLIAALHFPGVPIVHFCHGWLPWEEGPLRHPAIARYVAVDETCADRLTGEGGIGRDQVDLLLNFVDLQRFRPRDPLPPRPRRALVVSNEADGQGFAETIREACREQNIELEIIGNRSGRSVARPQDILPGFDLVFAKARAALEAMAVGCSVVLADRVGCGPMVTERDFDRMRAANFGVRWLQHPHSVDWYRAQIAAYDAAAAGRIAVRVRADADLEIAVDRLLDIYQRALAVRQPAAASSDRTVSGCTEAQRAAARHLSSIALRFKQAQTSSGELAAANADRQRLLADRQELLTRIDLLVNERTARDVDLDGQLATERERADRLDAAVRRLSSDLTALRNDRDRVLEERQALVRQATALEHEVAAACRVNVDLTSHRDHLQQVVETYRALPSLRLRDTLLGVPILGTAAQRVARWLSAVSSR